MTVPGPEIADIAVAFIALALIGGALEWMVWVWGRRRR